MALRPALARSLAVRASIVSTSADLQVLGSNSGRHELDLRGRWKKGTVGVLRLLEIAGVGKFEAV